MVKSAGRFNPRGVAVDYLYGIARHLVCNAASAAARGSR